MTAIGSSSLRLLVHALDRTGPPVLALAFARWLRHHQPLIGVDTVAFRGGPMIDEFTEVGNVVVLLDPAEAWDHQRVDPLATRRVRERSAGLGPVDALLAVSVAATQCLPYLPEPLPRLFTWVVERGADLHWAETPVHPSVMATRWLAGSAGSASDLRTALGGPVDVEIVPEFVERPRPVDPSTAAQRRRAMGAGPEDLLVVGAGIATERKGPDLFTEVAAHRWPGAPPRFVWIGGEQDDLFHRYVLDARRIGPDGPRFLGNVRDISGWLGAADVLCHTARLDAFPLVCLHAALSGTPVVGFAQVAGLEEMFGSAALTVPYPDVPALAARICWLADQDVRAEVVAEQQRAVTSCHTADVAAPELLRALGIAGTHPGSPS